MIKIGIISDTHGLLRPEAIAALADSDLILHAGDIGNPGVISQLGEIARVTAIRGNIDKEAWAADFPDDAVVKVADTYIYMIHNIHDLELDPATAGYQVVVSGHSHKSNIERINGVLYINPGSAGPRRFSLPITLAHMTISTDGIAAEITKLGI